MEATSMPTYQTNSTLCDPINGERVPIGTLAYFEARNRHSVYELVMGELDRKNISQAELGRRLNKDPGQISRMLGTPGNWTLNTVSNLLFAISGAEPRYSLGYPLKEPARNYRRPAYLESTATVSKGVANNTLQAYDATSPVFEPSTSSTVVRIR